ncbi:MAG: hypothetical protein ACD_14C00066G0001 [uncultured bacterium]|nr:MAG: hypothetical protein ACD_14C00066G0001 [uncultured bacterium]KKQ59999.1 MAG: hypothetical protein US82_C0046G0004 [Parcubacteria group bacterium GW2011_GWC1_38_22]KKQ81310.1 MAG: hypothetical protein UT03_C0006G0008 [Candidatus Moranbacteria bacterium GW2011_GWD2_38_7]
MKSLKFFTACIVFLGCISLNEAVSLASTQDDDQKMVLLMISEPSDNLITEENMLVNCIARNMANLQCPDLKHFSPTAINTVFNDALDGGGIDQGWLDDVMLLVRSYDQELIIKTTPRKAMTLIPDPSVHITVQIGERERNYIIAPGYLVKVICK